MLLKLEKYQGNLFKNLKRSLKLQYEAKLKWKLIRSVIKITNKSLHKKSKSSKNINNP